ncbi:sensor histidine kinase [Alteribacillus persepolensis]|uniref:sensor histidine kinase n=1 Tax=Alteribacillus persepolensis TaxID=568899 RepID=UPI000B83CCA4
MARSEATDQTVQLTKALTNLFRISISKGRDIITIEEELRHVESYFVIQKIRYQDQFDYSIHCSPGLFQYQTIKLLLQPLVKNAICHGFNLKKEPGFISVDISETEDTLFFPYMIPVGMTQQLPEHFTQC